MTKDMYGCGRARTPEQSTGNTVTEMDNSQGDQERKQLIL